ncbi:MAG TPA: hypothetical protein PKA06_09950, partial [Gemmatales bacterium]|nr:hypothetical protein [Gemmatales bacterium]
MRVRHLLLAAFLLGSLLQTGCGLGKQLSTNLIFDPLKWDRYSDGIARHIRDKNLAEEAWDEICSRDGDVYSRHYRRGFFDGFQDYLDSGGTGDPPTLPPRSYWRIYYQTPEGYEAIQDWFEGWRHGASVARASGIRDYITVPVSSIPTPEVSDAIQSSDFRPSSYREPAEAIPAPGTAKPRETRPTEVKPPDTEKRPEITPPKSV